MLHRDMSDLEILAEMIENDVLRDLQTFDSLTLDGNLNSIGLDITSAFIPVVQDCEPVPLSELHELIDIQRKFGQVGCICWASKHRDEDPLIEYKSSEVFQETWNALYGNLCVKPNKYQLAAQDGDKQ